jgi:hypothetical protein
VGAGIAFASVPRVQPANKPVTQKPVSATYSAASAELARLRADLAGSAHDTALLRALITRLQHDVDAAQGQLEQVSSVGSRPAKSSGALPKRPARPNSTTTPMRAHRSPSPPTQPEPTPSDDDGSGND